jgi:hypothetical protein
MWIHPKIRPPPTTATAIIIFCPPPPYSRCTVDCPRELNRDRLEQLYRDEAGIPCSKYLRLTGIVCRQTTRQLLPLSFSSSSIQSGTQKGKTVIAVVSKDQSSSSSGSSSSLHHRRTEIKGQGIAHVFASWLIETFSREVLLVDQNGVVGAQTGSESNSGSGVLDIAGGKGQLSIELSMQAGGIFCTVIDPLVRKRGMSSNSSNGNGRGRVVGLSSRDKKRLDKVGAAQPLHVARPFGDGLLKIPQYDTLVKEASCLVGLHPDECTEAILDKALLYGKPVAIVPCCVFPHMFPDRYLTDRPDFPVTTYEDFLQYLLEKDDRLQRATLPFEGRNQVIYYV